MSGRDDTIDRETSEFLLRACHDLRSSLRGVRAHAELLAKQGQGQAAADLEQRLRFIVDGARRIDLLVDGISSYAIALRIEPSTFQSSPMGALLRIALARLADEAQEHNAEITYETLPVARGDPDRLTEVWESLLRNALRHGGQRSPRIRITVQERAEDWLFGITDNGGGVEAACLEEIFKPFQRLGGNEDTGPGLGLAICRAIVERHGGRIWAESEPGAGATFYFTLPRDL